MISRLILTAALFFVSFGLNSAQIQNPDGELESLHADDIWAKTLEGRYFNEFWNYQLYLNNGIKAHIIFNVANFGRMKSPVSGIRVSINNLNGELYQLQREFPIERLVQDKENYEFRLRQDREIYFRGKLPEEHSIVIQTSKDGDTYDINLRFYNIQSGFRWADGNYTINNEKVGILTHIPYAEVRGHIAVNNVRRNVSGTVYMDHTYQDQMTSKLLHSGYRFISHQSPSDWDLYYFLLADGAPDLRTIGYRLQNRNGSVSLQGVNRIQRERRSDAFGEDIPRELDLRMQNGDVVRFERVTDEEKFSILRELGSFSRRVARRFLGGEVIDFRGEARLNDSGNSKPVEYNLFMVK